MLLSTSYISISCIASLICFILWCIFSTLARYLAFAISYMSCTFWYRLFSSRNSWTFSFRLLWLETIDYYLFWWIWVSAASKASSFSRTPNFFSTALLNTFPSWITLLSTWLNYEVVAFDRTSRSSTVFASISLVWSRSASNLISSSLT